MAESRRRRHLCPRASHSILKHLGSLGEGLDEGRGTRSRIAAQHGSHMTCMGAEYLVLENRSNGASLRWQTCLGSPWNIRMEMSNVSWTDRPGAQALPLEAEGLSLGDIDEVRRVEETTLVGRRQGSPRTGFSGTGRKDIFCVSIPYPRAG